MKLISNALITSLIASGLLLTGCGGGGGDSSGPSTGGTVKWVEGEFIPYAQLSNQCDAGLKEKLWLRSWSNDTYLWYSEIIDRDPAPYQVLEYFDFLKTENLSATGNPKDKFHFSMPTSEWEQLNQSGASVGYGMSFYLQQRSDETDRKVTVAYTEPNSQATSANIARGAVIVSVDGVSVQDASDTASIDIINKGLFPDDEGQETRFTLQDLGASQTRDVVLTAQTVVSTPVQNTKVLATPSGTIGYMQFNAHIATAERGLYDAIATLATARVDDLVLDLRYNGGGLLAMASQLGYMIAGQQATQDRIFENVSFNDKYPTKNPVTGETLTPRPFYDETFGFNPGLLAGGKSLPSLNLSRVFVLTTDRTCSASESLINSLRGIDVEVIQIGGTTCGKPYGFYPTPNCGTTYFSIQFKGVNDKGYGDYTDGFVPSSNPTLQSEVPGCDIADDFSHALGDKEESQLAAALYYRDNNSCPAQMAKVSRAQAKPQFVDVGYILEDTRNQNILLNNRILTQPK
ncbi:S41 family peptidase [Shewanella insulae]|uniref:S41 family peptidase n=1 Tax=Shewanella insulae TaxID=2681496 RepID=UPI001EFCE865|nr:S41 family peptidase [Shewanella insulae]MCG9754047.1 S41 family peptidase [Shewanella insulae]